MTHESLITVFAWMSVINLIFFIIGLLKITHLRSLTEGLNKMMFGERSDEIMAAVPKVLLHYYILILMFNIVPYLVLRFAL